MGGARMSKAASWSSPWPAWSLRGQRGERGRAGGKSAVAITSGGPEWPRARRGPTAASALPAAPMPLDVLDQPTPLKGVLRPGRKTDLDANLGFCDISALDFSPRGGWGQHAIALEPLLRGGPNHRSGHIGRLRIRSDTQEDGRTGFPGQTGPATANEFYRPAECRVGRRIAGD